MSAIINAANAKAGLCSGAFASIYGRYLATVARVWTTRDFVGNNMPVTLEGATSTLGGSSGYTYFVSPGQVNIVVPRLSPGIKAVRVKTPSGESAPITGTISEFCPAAFMFDDQRYVVAVYANGAVARTPSVAGRNARPGDVVSLYVTGLGPTVPAYPEGELVPVALQTANQVRVSIGGQPADVLYAGLVSPGLYQINIRIPVVSVGEQPVQIEVAGIRSPDQVSFLISQP